MAFLGGVVSIGLGKLIWGGLGYNLFNPALVGRAFLLATFPIAMTTWSAQTGPTDFFDVQSSILALPFMQATYDGMSAATPLGLMKFEDQSTGIRDLIIGKTSGCIGETSGLLLVLGGIYLLLRRDLDWRIPASILLSVAVFSLLLFAIAPDKYPGPLFALFSGGLLIGAIYMATDPGNLPHHPRGGLDLRRRRGAPGGADPGVRWLPRGGHVRHPADERGHAADRPLHPAAGVRQGDEDRMSGEHETVLKPDEPGSAQLVATLGFAGLLSGLIIVSVFEATLPTITAYKAKVLREAVFKVLPGTAQLQRLVYRDGELTAKKSEEPDEEALFGGYDTERPTPGLRHPRRRSRLPGHHQPALRLSAGQAQGGGHGDPGEPRDPGPGRQDLQGRGLCRQLR